MKRKRYQKFRQTSIFAVAALAVFSLCPVKALAVESIMLPTQVVGDDVVSMSIPVVSDSETSVFDFILDPQRLLYRTDAARYGGGRVEEGATLLFYNKEGEYDFSRHSDWLTVTNRSTVPVQVTVTAQLVDLGDIKLAESDDFGENTEPAVYIAIEDDKGNIQPLSANGQAVIHLEMAAAPENTYVFRLDEENHTYHYGMSMDPDKVDFDTYSFGLIGACNSNAEWQNLSVHPTITVTWCVEPLMPEEQEEISEEESMEEENGNIISDDTKEDERIDESDDKNDKESGEDVTGDDIGDEEQPDSEADDDNDSDSAGDSVSDELDDEQSAADFDDEI